MHGTPFLGVVCFDRAPGRNKLSASVGGRSQQWRDWGTQCRHRAGALARAHEWKRRARVAAGDAVYAGSSGHWLYAFSSADGTLRWSLYVGGEVQNRPTISPSGMIGFVSVGCFAPTSCYRYLKAFDVASGKILWSTPSDGPGHSGGGCSSPAVSPDGKTVFIGSLYPAGVYAFGASAGNLLWAFPTSDQANVSPRLSADGSRLYFGSYNCNLYAVDTATGSQIWASLVDECPPGDPHDGEIVSLQRGGNSTKR